MRMAVYLLSYQGTLLGGVEEFQHSAVIDVTLPVSDEEVLDIAEDGLNALTGYTGFLGNHNSQTAWTNIRAARVLDLGTGALYAAVNRAVSKVGTASGTASVPVPSMAVAVTTLAGPKPNGTPYRGRFYLPAPAFGSAYDGGRLTSTYATLVANAAAAMFTALDQVTFGAAGQVWSRTASTTSTVSSVRCGRAVDVIRSRRRDVPEDYVTVAV